MNIQDATILITGGASGIGKIMGRMALEKGARKIIIWDINKANIDATIAGKYTKYAGYVVDVSDKEAVQQAYRQSVEDCGDIDILINCAGIVTGNKTFDQMTYEEIIRTMNINAIAPMLVARTMLPRMIERNKGLICNIASAAGMLPDPKMSAYGASKWSVIGWGESVRVELQSRKSAVVFTTIAPYYINTGMFDGVSCRLCKILDPEKTSRKILRAIEKDKTFKGIPFSFHFMRFCTAVLPFKVFDYILGEVFGIYHAMDHFTGRKK